MSKLSNKHFVFFAFIFTVFLGSCKSSTSPGTTMATVPGVGSFFITYVVNRDSTNAITSTDTEKDTFVRTGQSLFGKTNVAVVVSTTTDPAISDTDYIHYESNGDVSVNAVIDINAGWMLFPFASQGSMKVGDTSGVGFHVTATVAGAGQGSVTIKGQSVPTETVTLTKVTYDTIAGHVYTETNVQTYQFAPSLGWLVETDAPAERNPNGSLSLSSHDIVIDYKLY
jgi:hypothetical protein